MTDRTPPQDVDTEMCVLGAIMLEPQEAYPIAADILSPADFYLEGHGEIFATAGRLHDRGIPPDSVALLDELKATGKLDEPCGGSAVLVGMMGSAFSTTNLEAHSRLVKEKSTLRQLMAVGLQIAEDCCNPQIAAADVIDAALVRVSDVAEGNTTAIAQLAKEPVFESFNELAARLEVIRGALESGEKIPHDPRGLPTGYYDIDRMTEGLKPGELTVIAARPSMGKTCLALNISRNLAHIGMPVAFVSLEMTAKELSQRLIGMCTWDGKSGVDLIEARRNGIAPLDEPRLQKGYEDAHALPLWIIDAGVSTVPHIRGQARRLVQQKGVGLVVVDYLGLIEGVRHRDHRVQEVGEVSRALKAMAKELRVPVIVACQLNRANVGRTDKRPNLADLRDSGEIEQDADVVMFIHRPSYYADNRADTVSPDPTEILVAKNRNGPLGRCDLLMTMEIGKFHNASRR